MINVYFYFPEEYSSIAEKHELFKNIGEIEPDNPEHDLKKDMHLALQVLYNSLCVDASFLMHKALLGRD